MVGLARPMSALARITFVLLPSSTYCAFRLSIPPVDSIDALIFISLWKVRGFGVLGFWGFGFRV